MGSQIIKQPNGLYAVFSSVVDAFVIYDATIEELIDDAVADYRKDTQVSLRRIAAELERGGKPYHQFTMTFDEAVQHCRECYTGTDDNETLEELEEIIKAANTAVNQPTPQSERLLTDAYTVSIIGRHPTSYALAGDRCYITRNSSNELFAEFMAEDEFPYAVSNNIAIGIGRVIDSINRSDGTRAYLVAWRHVVVEELTNGRVMDTNEFAGYLAKQEEE